MNRPQVQRFEELIAWQKARGLATSVYRMTQSPQIARDFGLVDQLRRAAVSIMNNIAEGFERKSNGEFSYFLGVAKGSAGEVRSMMYLAVDVGYLTEQDAQQLMRQAEEVSRILVGLRRSLIATPTKGKSS